jgi:hypothetical protein
LSAIPVAMAEVEKSLVTAQEVRREVEILLTSKHFARSEKQSSLLNYLCEKWIEGNAEQLNEYQLALEVFHRRADHSGAEDSIVRVQAHELRRRLNEYYLAEGKDRPVRIEIPKGSYRPQFTRVPAAVPIAGAIRATSERVAFGSSVVLYSFASLLLVSAGLNLWLMASHSHSKSHLSVTGDLGREYASYSEMFSGTRAGSDTLISLSNPRVLLLYGTDVAPPTSFLTNQTLPLTPQTEKMLEGREPSAEAPFPHMLLHPTSDEYTGMGEAVAAYQLGQLMQTLTVRSRLTQARFLNWNQALQDNVILLGLPHATPWTNENISSQFFRETSSGSLVLNGPLTNGSSEYGPAYDQKTGAILTDYGVISKETTSTGSWVLILAGASSFGTYGAGEFLCDPQKMHPVFEKLKSLAGKNEIPQNFLVLVKVKVSENIPVDVSYVTALTHSPGNEPVKSDSVPDNSKLSSAKSVNR